MTDKKQDAHDELMQLADRYRTSNYEERDSNREVLVSHTRTLIDRIAELEARLDAVGAGGVSAFIPKAERERAALAAAHQAFERWQFNALCRDLQELSMNASGDYDCDDIQCEWQAWQASAMLAAASQPKSAAPLIPITSFVAAAAFASEPFTDDTFAAFQQGVRFAERVHGVSNGTE